MRIGMSPRVNVRKKIWLSAPTQMLSQLPICMSSNYCAIAAMSVRGLLVAPRHAITLQQAALWHFTTAAFKQAYAKGRPT
jgi:hypothetical protein